MALPAHQSIVHKPKVLLCGPLLFDQGDLPLKFLLKLRELYRQIPHKGSLLTNSSKSSA